MISRCPVPPPGAGDYISSPPWEAKGCCLCPGGRGVFRPSPKAAGSAFTPPGAEGMWLGFALLCPSTEGLQPPASGVGAPVPSGLPAEGHARPREPWGSAFSRVCMRPPPPRAAGDLAPPGRAGPSLKFCLLGDLVTSAL